MKSPCLSIGTGLWLTVVACGTAAPSIPPLDSPAPISTTTDGEVRRTALESPTSPTLPSPLSAAQGIDEGQVRGVRILPAPLPCHLWPLGVATTCVLFRPLPPAIPPARKSSGPIRIQLRTPTGPPPARVLIVINDTLLHVPGSDAAADSAVGKLLTDGCTVSIDRLSAASAMERFGKRGVHGAALIRLVERKADAECPAG